MRKIVQLREQRKALVTSYKDKIAQITTMEDLALFKEELDQDSKLNVYYYNQVKRSYNSRKEDIKARNKSENESERNRIVSIISTKIKGLTSKTMKKAIHEEIKFSILLKSEKD